MGTLIGIVILMAFILLAAWCKFEYEKMVVKEALRERDRDLSNKK